MLQENANKSAKFVKVFPGKVKKNNPYKKHWFSESCKDLRTLVKNYEKLVDKFPEKDEYRTL